jgi:hypothetical protein
MSFTVICIQMIVLLSELWYTYEFCAFSLLYKNVLHTCVFILKKYMEKVFINSFSQMFFMVTVFIVYFE